MSNDPFHSNEPAPVAGDGDSPDRDASSPKRWNWWWVLGIGASVSLLSLIVCCGLLTYGFTKMGSVFFEPIRMELNGLAEVQESVGRVDQLTMNFTASTEEGKSNPGFVVLDAETANGPYQFSVKIGSGGEIEQGFMINPDGTREELNLTDSNNDPAETTEPAGGVQPAVINEPAGATADPASD